MQHDIQQNHSAISKVWLAQGAMTTLKIMENKW